MLEVNLIERPLAREVPGTGIVECTICGKRIAEQYSNHGNLPVEMLCLCGDKPGQGPIKFQQPEHNALDGRPINLRTDAPLDKFGPPQVGDIVESTQTDGLRLRVRDKCGDRLFFGVEGAYSGHVGAYKVVSRDPAGPGDMYEKDGRQWFCEAAADGLILWRICRTSTEGSEYLPISAADGMKRVYFAPRKGAAHETRPSPLCNNPNCAEHG